MKREGEFQERAGNFLKAKLENAGTENTGSEMNSFSGLLIGHYTAKENINELEDFLIEIIRVETHRENGEGGEIMRCTQSQQEPQCGQ